MVWPVALLIVRILGSHGQTVPKQKVSVNKSLLTVDLTIKNPLSKEMYLTGIGVEVRDRSVNSERGVVEDEGEPLLSVADYNFEFAFYPESKEIKANPPLSIPAGKAVRYTVSLLPLYTGQIVDWSCKVTVISIFDDGSRMRSDEYSISSASSARTLDHETMQTIVEAGADSPNPIVRAAAYRVLKNAQFPDASAYALLCRGMRDKDIDVRYSAAVSILTLVLKHNPKVATLLPKAIGLGKSTRLVGAPILAASYVRCLASRGLPPPEWYRS